MNKNLKKYFVTSLATMTALSALGTVPTFAFGEYEKNNGTAVLNGNYENSQDYKNWYANQWDNQETGEKDSGKIVLTPGSKETDLNFAWYSETKGTPQVKISKKQDMSNAKVVEGEATSINKTNQFKTYVASNKVSITNYLEENTTYYYQYSIDGSTWSAATKYQTHSFSNYQAVLVGDPQIGASGSRDQGKENDLDIAVNTYAWNKTLEKALGEDGIAKDASFILSAGDQVDYSSGTGKGYEIREQEYAGYLYPSVLRSVPVATSIGNHESQGDDYSLHYNNPNASELGKTESGGDYYYSYGDALYIVLNSNNRNVEEHRKLMNEAVASHEDAKWKVVMFHHDIYGSGAPHSDIDGANLRILFAPLMDEFDIDVCLTGHDHSYARTYQIVDGKVIETEGVSTSASTAYNPEGTLYIAAGSASGSKFYTLNTTKQYYIAERSNTPIPTFSTLDFSKDALTIKTYDNEGEKYAYDVTIKKDDKATSIEEMKASVEAIDKVTITSGSKTRIEEALANAKKVLDQRDDSQAITQLTDDWNGYVTNVNTASDPLDYYGYAKEGFKNKNTKALKQGFSSLLDKTLYENDTNQKVTTTALNTAYAKLASAKDEVITKAEFADLQNQFDEAGKLLTSLTVGDKKGEYKETNVKAYKSVLANLKAQMNEATLTKTQFNELSETLTQETNDFKASVNTQDAIITPVVDNKPSQSIEVDNTKPVTSTEVVDTSDNANVLLTGIMGTLSFIGIAVSQLLKKKEIED